MIDLSTYRSHFDRGATLPKEALWWVVKCLFFLPKYPLPSRFRTGLLRLFGAKIGTGVVVRAGVNITFPWRLTLGDHVWLGEEVMLLNLAPIQVGSHVCVSQRAFLCTGSHRFDQSTFDLVTKEIVVEDGCWIAAGSFICPGVRMQRGSMCAAGSVVTRDVASGAVVGGNPARPIRSAAI